MTYRNDLDALAAREAALAKEVADKAKERDEVEQQLIRARAQQEAEERAANAVRRKRTSRWIAGTAGVLFLAGGGGYLVYRHHARIHRLYTCDELLPEHLELDRQTNTNYMRALAAKGLSELGLEPVNIGDYNDQPGLKTQDDVDKAVGHSANPWEVIPYVKDGKERRAIVGETRSFDTTPRDDDEFVTDGKGGVWRLVRAPRSRVVHSVTVKTCQWGCRGHPPPGMPPPQTLHRTLWLLRDGDTFRGEVEIQYDAPTVDEHPTEDCDYPE